VLKLVENLDIVPTTYFKKPVNAEEIMVQFGSTSYRLFCFFVDNSIVVLTHGISKKSRKTPKQEIERAEAYRKDFLSWR